MQVEWETIVAVAETRAIDLWILFPLGQGVNRVVTRSGDMHPGWRRRLNLTFGTEEWYDEFYRREVAADLFGEHEMVVKQSIDVIGHYFVKRLKTIFAGVTEPASLRNSVGCPLFLLCFAASNPIGAPIACRIANSLLRKVE